MLPDMSRDQRFDEFQNTLLKIARTARQIFLASDNVITVQALACELSKSLHANRATPL
jgi:hypothetical protein